MIFFQHLAYELPQLQRPQLALLILVAQRQLGVLQTFEIIIHCSVLFGLAVEWLAPVIRQLIDHAAKRKHIYLRVSFVIIDDLRCHVERTSLEGQVFHQGRVLDALG